MSPRRPSGADPVRSLMRVFAAALLLAVLQGCASFQGAPDWNRSQNAKEADPMFDAAVERFYAARTPERRVAVRNRFIETRMAIINRSYAAYKESIYTQRTGSAVGVDLATMLLGAAGAAVSDVGTKTGAAALSAGLIGGKASIDKNLYFDRTLPAMLAQMDGLRSQVRARILAGMTTDVDTYRLTQAASDLDDYFNAGTILGAISAITTQAGITQTAADAVLRDRLPSEADLSAALKAKGFTVTRAAQTATTDLLDECLKDDENKYKPGVEVALLAWLRGQGVKLDGVMTPLSNFLTDEGDEAEKRRAAFLNDAGMQAQLKQWACK
jgi:hypothetical protein